MFIIFIPFSVPLEPPDDPRIFDAQGKEVAGIAGPFREGSELFLSCQVSGGKFSHPFIHSFPAEALRSRVEEVRCEWVASVICNILKW